MITAAALRQWLFLPEVDPMAAERKKSMDSGLRGNALSALKEACMLSSLPIDECYSKLGSARGLDPDRVLASRERHGVNRNASLKRKSVPERLFSSFVTPFTLLLFAVAAITAVVELLSDSGDPTWWLTPLIIIVMVMISGLVSFVENGRSERSSDALRRYTENTSTVIREDKPAEVGNGEIVYGDLVRLGAGDMLPADSDQRPPQWRAHSNMQRLPWDVEGPDRIRERQRCGTARHQGRYRPHKGNGRPPRLVAILAVYLALTRLGKRIYKKKFGKLL